MMRSLVMTGVLLVPGVLAAQTTTSTAQPARATAAQQPRSEEARPAPAQPTSREGFVTVPDRAIVRSVAAESAGQIAARRAGQPVNIKVDVTISDQTDNEPRRRKTVTVVTADGLTGYVRSAGESATGPAPLNVDVEPRILTGGKVRVLLNLQYALPTLTERQPNDPARRGTELRENLSLILEDGKPLVVSQSADAMSDRRVTVEVIASIGK